ncbi:fused DSP-PTPase phosphatase/NAD kinase-like protein [Clostridium saccharobutylicum]|uniref:Effector protein HopD2 n=1 Tax=Clostridium saccharobutylicum DSM 13864 TaxID=1345695 RepID=U5MU60_CLOSA|nr:effector protein HopD2 [Clostridium saccharobutylicum]AGX44063.1 effector protein HopD2 [Clostridium saccharobutylicum DSM 13864]AQR91354.1 effector protein hopD2 [Clostridium saccharobutylicum]AQS01258.1 effector protein hopD2 [Clostridium saccharobutylicum]AQS15241.1 effector protein hopD2 [Clostridium saccharobutylicum]MBA2905884.1 protein-tyrosine phosphatase [Clostridium saccharobutylicum]
MKNKKIIYIIGVVIIGALTSGYFIEHYYNITKKTDIKTEGMQNSKINLVIDTENKDVLPKNFRTTKDEINSEKLGDTSLLGLSDLNISGSGALSEKGLAMIKEKIGNKITMDIDLRQEDHGFVNGMGISWFGKDDQANKGLSRDQIIADEKNKLNEISKNGYVMFDTLPKGKSVNTISEINNPENVQTEEELAKSLGMSYLRITVTDHEKPLDDQVDLFVESVINLPQDTWLHFHCRGGAGRTTTFMAMYDMMHNAKNVSFEDIMKRQNLIGGSDLLKSEDKDESQDRSDFINKFYDYCKENQDGFQTSWSQWIKKSEKKS